MRGKQALFLSLLIIAIVAVAGVPKKTQYYEINADGDPDLIAGRNVNMVSGMSLPDGDPYLQRQNEPSIAVSTRNPLHLLAGANDYRTVDIPLSEGELPGQMQNQAAGDAWLGVFKSLDGGQSWTSTLLDGYPQQNNSNSPLDGYDAAADPVVRAGANGLFFYSGIVFDRLVTENNAVFVARFIDNNNDEEGDPISHIDTTIIDELNGDRFKDKPWIAVGIPKKNAKTINIAGQNIPRYNVYIVYSVFKEVDGEQQSEILFCRSTDCGSTWEAPIVLSSGHYLNQGATIAVDPRDNAHIFVAWRRFASSAGGPAQADAIVIARSTNEGKEFPDVVEVAEVPGPFDQPTSSAGDPLSGTAFRTNSYPTMTVDSKGRVYLAWSQRGLDPLYPNDSRVVVATSKDGIVWTTPMEVESAVMSANGSDCYGFMPTITFAGGRLILAWYDTRNDCCPEISPEWICDSGAIRHTIDVRVAIGRTGEFPVFQPSVQVSRYLWAMEEVGSGNYYFHQVQFNPPNYPLFKGGTVPFHGDYIEIAPSPSIVLDSKGVWRFNTEPTDSHDFHLAWTDNRDVRPPLDNNWTIYNAPNSSQSSSQFEFFVKNGCVDPERTGMRNQNVYTACVTSVIEAGSPGNKKPLGTLGTNPTTGDLIPRAFVIYVKNPTKDIRHYRMRITDAPDHGTASFLEFDILEEIDISIAPFSSISRPLFVASSDENDTVTVEVFEIDELGGSPITGGVRSTIVINPDKTNPDVIGDLANTETHDPDIANPNIVNWTYVNPNIVNPNIVNPNIVNPNIVNPNIVNPNIVNPNIVNPNIVNPTIENPNIVNPNIVNPNIVNSSISDSSIENADVTDIEWAVTNAGNTVSSYTFKIFARESLPKGIYAQLLVYKVHYAPATDGTSCELKQTPHHELLLNVVNPNIVNPNIVNPNIVNPNIVNAAIENATFFLSPGDEAKAVLRLIDPDPGVTKFLQSGRKFKIQAFAESLGAAAGSQAVDSEDAQQGDTTGDADSTELIIITAELPDGTVGMAYPTIQLEAAGGEGTYVWYVNSESLPPGIGFTNDGIISGIPQNDPNVTYPRIYSFIVQVTSGKQVDTQNLSITINSAEEPTPPLNIQTTTLPPGTVGNYYGYTLLATGGKLPRTWSKASGTLPLGLTLDSAGVISGTIAADPNVTYPHTYSFVVKVTDAAMDTDTQSLGISVDEIEYPDLTISGTITGQGGSPVSGVTIYGLPRAPKTDSYGFYSDTVPYGWSGTITPFKAGYTFRISAQDPSPSRTYVQITADQLSQDFTANTINYTVSGIVTFYGSPLAGVTMNGLPGTPVTDANGYYSAPVPHGWSGTITPELLDYIFEPPSRSYTSITSDHVLQNYVAFYVGVGQDDPFEDNDDFASASRIIPGAITNLQLYDDDWYRINVAEGEDLGVTVNGNIVNDIDVEIRDSSGIRIAGAYGSLPDETAYASDLSSGWYYIYVIYLGDSGFWNSYSMTVETGDITTYGDIAGRVTNPSMNGIPGVEIWSYDTQSEHYFITATDADGDYRISLPASVYKLKFDASNVTPETYVSEYYDSKYTYEDADEVPLQAGDMIGGVDAQLEEGSVLAIATTSLPNGNVANPYSATLEAFGGITPYTWSLAQGSGPLPNGLILHETGLIDGIPTTTGTFDFTIQVTDSSSPNPQADERAFSATIGSADTYPEGMISYWKFDEGDGSNAYDSFDTNHGTIIGAAWTLGQVNDALSFDGVDDYVSVGDFAGYSDNVSVEAWIRTPGSGGVDNWDDIVCGPVGDIIFGISGNRLNFAGQGAIPIDHNTWSTTLLNDNEWHHVAGTYDGSQVCVYVDGQQEACNPASGTFSPGFKYIGRGDYDGEHFNGLIDEVAIYNRALLPLEIEQHYLNGLNGLGYEVPEGDLVITTTSLPDGNVATAYSAPLEAAGGTEPYSWSLAPGSDPLPGGLTLHSDGVIDGTPTTLGTFNFIVEVTDGSSPLPQTATQPLSITINAYAGSDYAISGTVTPSLAGVVMSGLPGNPVTDGSGGYTAYVYSGWSGTVTPIFAGYAFDPASRTYNNVSGDLPDQNYTASAGYAISGLVTLDGSPLEGVLMSGLPGDPYTNADGLYSGAVPSGWSGSVTPTLPGFTFSPSNRTYATVTLDQTNEDYTATFQGGQDDIYENNDNFASAAEISLGTHTNLVLRDEDWFKVYVSAADAGKDLKVHIKGTSCPNPNYRRDLDFFVLNSAEKLMSMNYCGSDDELIFLTDITEGWYYIGQTYINQTGAVYSMTVEISDNFGIGYISGRVTDEKSGQGIEGVYVELNAQEFDYNISHPLITTDADGYYKIGYFSGNYRILFNQLNLRHRDPWAPDVNYIGETYNNNGIIPIVAGATVSDIDAELIPGGTITGRVTDPDGNGLWMARVNIYESSTYRVSSAYSNENGYYSAERMRTGNYNVRFDQYDYASIWFKDAGSFDEGHPVAVREGATTPNIDARLIESGSIEGRVTDSNGSPLQGVSVDAYDVSGIYLTSAYTDDNGDYRFYGWLPAGDVVVFFDAGYVQGDYASEYYTDKYLLEEADPITVQSGQTTYGIDAVLVEGGTISGRVTDVQGDGFQNVVVNCVDTASDRYHYATPDEEGNYAISTLPPGDYKVRFRPYSDELALEWYNDQNSFVDGGIVSVNSGQTTQGINAQLESVGGSVTGRVTNSSGVGIEGIVVQALDSTKKVMFAGSAWTDSDGFYTIKHMTDGNVKIYFNADYHYLYYVPYISEYYNDKNAYENADSVPTALGQTTSGINAILAPIPPVNITTTSLPNGEVAVPYEVALEATGGREFYHWSLISGSLPPGLSLNSKGEILGTPAASGTRNFTVRVTDSCRNQTVDTQTLSITIDAYTGAGYLISGAITSGGSPLGGVVLQGLPGNPETSPGGDYIAVVPQDWSGTVTPTLSGFFFDPQSRNYADVGANLSGQDYTAYERTLYVATEWLLNGVEGYPYNQPLSAEGGTGPYTWNLAPGSSPLPYGLALSSDGTISGTPTHQGQYDFTVRVEDSSSPIPQYNTRELTLNVYGDPVSDYPILYWKLDENQGTIAFDSSGHNARGILNGSAAYTSDAVDGHAVEINTYGWIERETFWAPFNFVNQATIMARVKIDDYNQQNRFVWKLQYDEPHRGHPYSLEVSMDINGSMLHLDSGNGLIQDIFNCPHYQIDVDLSSTGFTLGQYNQIAVTINDDVYKVFINGTEVASAVGASFAVNDSVQNFWVGGADWSDYWLGGKVDEILVFNKAYEPQDIQEIYNMGALPTISGTVRQSDGSPLPWVWMDGLEDVRTQENGEYIGVVAPGWSDTITPEMGGYYFDPPSRAYNNVTSIITGQDYTAYEQGALWIETGSIPNGKKGESYSTNLVAADGVPAYTWSVVSGSLPTGLTLNPNGEITGTPAEAGDFSFTARVLDSHDPPWAAEQYLTLFISADHQGFWTTTYPGGGNMHPEGLAIDPVDTNVVFSTAENRGIYKTTDAGSNWINLIDDPDWPFGETDYRVFKIHLITGKYFMCPGGRIYMSEDRGLNWQTIYEKEDWDIRTVTVDPTSATASIIYVGTWDGEMFKTTDGGANWSPIGSGLPNEQIAVITVDPNSASTLYAGTDSSGIYKSIDSGMNWASSNGSTQFHWIEDIEIDELRNIYVMAWTHDEGGGLFRSTDDGTTWTKLIDAEPGWSPGNCIAVDPNDVDTVYVGTYQNILKTEDAGENWATYSVSSVQTDAVVSHPTDSLILYAATQGEGVYKSIDGGQTWVRTSNGIQALTHPGGSPHSLEIDESNPNYIYAGTIGGGYRSLNGGTSWEKMEFPQWSMTAIKTHPSAAGTVFAVHNSLYKRTFDIVSGDWIDPVWGPENGFLCCASRMDLAIAHDNPLIMFIGARHTDDPQPGVHKSDDGGDTWTLKNNGFTYTDIHTLVIHPANHQIVFAGTEMEWPPDPGKDYGVYKTTDGGETWTYISSGLPDMHINQIVFYPGNPDIMYLVGWGEEMCGVFKSTDGGDSWFHASNYCPDSIAVSPDNPDLIYTGTWNGFPVSMNGGGSWMEFNDGLHRNPSVDAIHLDPLDPFHVFIMTSAGVYEATFSFDFMITTEYLPMGVVGESYSTFIEVAGGTPVYSWELVSGELPEGLAFNETTGEISGIPVEPDYREITIKAMDSGGNSYTKRYDLSISNKYFLNVNTNPPGVGSVTVDPDEPWYLYGAMVDVSVTIPGGYVFTGWTGDATGKATLVHVEMTRDKTLTANFATPGSLPDYDFSSFEAPGSANAGDTIGGPVNAEVRNQGAPDAYTGDISVGIYLSPNPEITTSDMLLWNGRLTIAPLSGGTVTVPIPADLQIPTTVSAGTYSIGILVDEFDVIAEQNEDNNFASLEITISSTPYDHLAFQGQWHGGESNAVACDEARNLAFVGNGALFQVLDVSDPSHPTKIGELVLGTKGISDITISGITAYVAGDGFRIVDISSPTSPNEIGYNDSPNLARGVVVSGDYAFVTDHFFQGLRVFNISDPSNPNQVSFTPFPGRTRGIAKSGNYLYVQAGVWLEEGETGIRIVNVSNPSSPSQVDFYATEGGTGWPEIAGNYLFLPTESEGLHILDISDPLNFPEAIVYSGLGNSGWVKAVGNHLYAFDLNRNAIVVLNIADVNNVYEEGVYYFENQTSVNCMDVLSNYCYADGWYNALKILDMSNPSNPTKVGSYDFEGLLRDVDVSEDFAYMTTYNERGIARFKTLDISSLPQVTEIGVFNNFNDMYRVRVSGNHAYVVTDNREFKVLDISDPSNPHEVAVYDDFDNIYDLEVSGNYAYVLDYYRGLQVIDISSPAHPVFVSQWYTNPRSIRLAISGNYAYVSALWAGVRIIDISDPMNPWEVGFYQAEDLRAYELKVFGNYVYVEDVDYNLRIIDVSDLQNPVEVGRFITNVLDISDIEVSGHVVFMGSYVRGMIVIDVSNPANPIKLDELPAFYTRAIAIRENRIYELVRGAGLIVYEYRRQ